MAKTAPVAIYYYLSDYADEVMPVARPTLEAWAEWLGKPDEDWGREAAAAPGEMFSVTTLHVLADLPFRLLEDGTGVIMDPLPEGCEEVFIRHDGPDSGWDVEAHTYSGALSPDTPEGFRADVETLIRECHTAPFSVDVEGYLACVRGGPELRARYDVTDGRSALVIIGAVQ